MRKRKSTKFKEQSACRSMRGATLVEMFCFMILIPCMLIGAILVHAIFKSWYGWLLGAALGALVFFIIGAIWALLHDLWSGSGLPKCRNGCCHGPGLFSGYGNYGVQESEGEYYYVCKYGDRYKRRGRQFLLVNKDGTETPYLIWRPFRGWRPDEEHEK